jgi:hypothetical protein
LVNRPLRSGFQPLAGPLPAQRHRTASRLRWTR